MDGKKVYQIIINGVEKSIKDLTTLETVLNRLDKTFKGADVQVKAAAKSSQTRAKALTDEEKAAKKLEATQKRIENVNSEANRAQVKANQELREKNRLLSREIAQNNLAEGSIKAMGMQLTDLRNEYESLSEEQRNNVEIGGELLARIQSLDENYKRLRESTGNFRDSVGNYQKAVSGLGQLESAMSKLGSASNGMQNSLLTSGVLMSSFGAMSEKASEAQKILAQVVALVAVAQAVSNETTKKGFLATSASVAMDKVKTVQLKAKAVAENLATKSTVGATIAQKAFNKVAMANPYVLLAMLLVTVVGALFAFSRRTETAAEKQKRLNEEQKTWLEYLETEKTRIETASNLRVKALERQIQLLQSQGGSIKQIQKLEKDVLIEKLAANKQIQDDYKNEIRLLNSNQENLREYYKILRRIKEYQAKGFKNVWVDFDLSGKKVKEKADKAIERIQGVIDNLETSINVAIELQTDEADLKNQLEILENNHKKANQDAIKEAQRYAVERAGVELEQIRKLEDLKLKLQGQSLEAQRQAIKYEYDRQVEDLKTKLKTDLTLNTGARQAINGQIVALEKLKNKELLKLDNERADAQLEIQKQIEDIRISLIADTLERRKAEITKNYNREIDDLRMRIFEEEGLTVGEKKKLNEKIVLLEQKQAQELEALRIERLKRISNIELQELETQFDKAKEKIGEVVSKQQSGAFKGVINIDETRSNIAEFNSILETYINGLTEHQKKLKETHEATLKTLQEGSPEYIEEIQKYATAHDELQKKITGAQIQITENIQKQQNLNIDYLKSAFDKISEYAAIAAEAITSVLDTFNLALQFSMDELNSQLETINQHYENASSLRQKYSENVEKIEEQIREANGKSLEVLKSNLQKQTALRNEAAREESRLALEKQKKEEEIAAKAKQMKRNELIGNIAMGIANTAQSVTKALTLVFPLNLVMAGLVGSMGTIQVGLMSQQLTKLADGGEIKGKSHAEGGARILGTNIEVEGGEFVVNKASYAANAPLVNMINETKGAVSVQDLASVMPMVEAPQVSQAFISEKSEQRIIEAIKNINFNPVVSVTDINDVQNDIVRVKEISGY